MKHFFSKACFALVFVFLVSAGNGISQVLNNLEIFSSEGKNFTLYLNGEKINSTPQSNVKAVDLAQNKCHVRVVFEDSHIPEIRKKNLELADKAPADKKASSNVYSIKEKEGKYKLVFVSRVGK